MKTLLFTVLFIGCVAMTVAGSDLPQALVGQWVGPGFKRVANEEAQPGGANIVYLFRDGHALIWGGEVGVPCLASYQVASQILILRIVRVDKGDPEAPIIMRLVHNPQTKTLKRVSVKAADHPKDLSTEIYRWHKTYIPAFVREAWEQQ